MGGRRKAYPKAWFWKSRSRQRSLSRPFRSFSTRERRQRERRNITFVILVSTEHLPSGHEGGAVPIDVRGPDYPHGSRLRFRRAIARVLRQTVRPVTCPPNYPAAEPNTAPLNP